MTASQPQSPIEMPPRVSSPTDSRSVGCLGWLVQWLGCIELWIVFSLVFVGLVRLTDTSESVSPFWIIDPLHSLLMGMLLMLERRTWPLRLQHLKPWQGKLLFIVVAWFCAMAYELTLRTAPGKFGGMHSTTTGSFLIAQGFYLPLAGMGLWLVHRYQLAFHELFFVAGVTGTYEATVFGVPYMLSAAFFLSPFIVAYYVVVYARFLSTGSLLIDQRLLWGPHARPISFARKLLYGLLASLLCWAIFVAWGELLLYLFDDFEGYA